MRPVYIAKNVFCCLATKIFELAKQNGWLQKAVQLLGAMLNKSVTISGHNSIYPGHAALSRNHFSVNTIHIS